MRRGVRVVIAENAHRPLCLVGIADALVAHPFGFGVLGIVDAAVARRIVPAHIPCSSRVVLKVGPSPRLQRDRPARYREALATGSGGCRRGHRLIDHLLEFHGNPVGESAY
jgi:hypothetical protein